MIQRGEIRWHRFRGPDKKRPVPVFTRNSVLDVLGDVTWRRSRPPSATSLLKWCLSVGDGMPRDCAVNLDHLQTVAKARLGSLIATISADRMVEVRGTLLFALGFDG